MLVYVIDIMEIKRIANEIKKNCEYWSAFGEYTTVFTGEKTIYPNDMVKINIIFKKHNVEINSIGIDMLGFIYIDLVKIP